MAIKKSTLRRVINEEIRRVLSEGPQINEGLKKVNLSMSDMVDINTGGQKGKLDSKLYDMIAKKWFGSGQGTITNKDVAIRQGTMQVTKGGKSWEFSMAGPYLKVKPDGGKTEFYKVK